MPYFASTLSSGVSKKRRNTQEYDDLSQELFTSQFLEDHGSLDFSFTQATPSSCKFQKSSQSQLFFMNSQSQQQEMTKHQFSYNFSFTQSQGQDELDFLNKNSQEEMQTESDSSNTMTSDCPPLRQNLCNQTLSQQSSTTDSPSIISNNCNEDVVVPDAVMNMYQLVKQQNYSDWTFISLIAGQLCTDVFPMGVYNNLKVALLMSLVSPISAPLHIIAIGRETSHANIVMNKLGKFSQRFLSVAENYDGITVKKNDTIEAGPMSLCTNGVAYIGNWSRLPPKVVQKYLREIELGIIIVDKLQMNFPLQATMWSYWSLSASVKKDSASIEQFLNVFGIPIIFDDQLSQESIVDDFLKQNSVSPPNRFNDFHISKRDFKSYLDYARNLEVEFDSQAEVMLRDYFIATKNIRPDTLTEKACEVLKKFAESHAKLCLRRIVMRQDVLVSISICEKFIKLLFDTDSYSSPIESKVTSIEHYDAYMSKLMAWYSCFTKDILEKM